MTKRIYVLCIAFLITIAIEIIVFASNVGTSCFVKLTVTGIKINLRPHPHAGGSVVA